MYTVFDVDDVDACLVIRTSDVRQTIQGVASATAAAKNPIFPVFLLGLVHTCIPAYGAFSLFVFLFPGGPHVATSRCLADLDASSGAPALRCIDRGVLRARTEDHHSGPRSVVRVHE